MKKNRSLAVVSEDDLINKIIKSLKNFLSFKQNVQKEEIINRKALVIEEEKIQVKSKKNITNEQLYEMEEKISKDISYINNLDEDELNSLEDYYNVRINELESVLNEKKSNYYKLISAQKRL